MSDDRSLQSPANITVARNRMDDEPHMVSNTGPIRSGSVAATSSQSNNFGSHT
jgi:hypothetical protein